MVRRVKWSWVGGAMIVMMSVVALGRIAGADVRGDLDSRKRDFDNLKSAYDNRRSEVERYTDKSRALRGFDKDELERLIKAMCGQDVERDGDEASRLNESLRDRSIETVKRQWDDTTRDWDSARDKLERLMNDIKALREQVKSISSDDSVKSDRSSLLDQIERLLEEVMKLYGKIQDDYRSLSNVKEGVMYGSNNPKIRAAMEFGKRKHVEMQSSFNCHEKEVVLSSGRPDCVRFDKDDCKVIEFKPSTVGSSEARSQAERYLSDVQRQYKDDRRAIENCRKDSSGNPIFSAVGETYSACSP